jgi:carbonic anhydrase/acetyltransferase-like protein (isoleucine patch superfamily)
MKVPPRSVVMGMPGKVVRPATSEEIEKTRTINARYREIALRYMSGEFPKFSPSPLGGEGRVRGELKP